MLAAEHNEPARNAGEAVRLLREAQGAVDETAHICMRNIHKLMEEANEGARAMGERMKAFRIENDARCAAAQKAIGDRGENQLMAMYAVVGGVIALGAIYDAVKRHRGKHTERLAAERQSQSAAVMGATR